ncbi:AAA domain-containing protein [Roseivirga sp. BDSF3-8]|uniref:AAA domain-containing protein n=1 Tax=Roseivirga sp. BDSF3-8 TaxID=3241598 RepID=UPI0035323CE0
MDKVATAPDVDISDIIRYFHDCYRSDKRDTGIYDFLDRKIEEKVIVEGEEELATDRMPIIPLDRGKAESILKKLSLFEKEKEFLYGSFFVCGAYTDFRGDVKRLFAPLFLWPATIEKREEDYYLGIKADERRINQSLLSLLFGEQEIDYHKNPLFTEFADNYLPFSEAGKLADIGASYFEHTDVSELYLYPRLMASSKAKALATKLKKQATEEKVMIPFSMAGLVDKSAGTRGIINELQELAEGQEFSAPLRHIFDLQESVKETATMVRAYGDRVPVLLSHAQQRILSSAARNTLTVVVGPPGTGKTYTIGAIALDHLTRGESVLIASRTDEAVDVIDNKLREQIGTSLFTLRAGKKREHRTIISRYLKGILASGDLAGYLFRKLGMGTVKGIGTVNSEYNELLSRTDRRRKQMAALTEGIEKETQREIEWGHQLAKNNKGLWDKVKDQVINVMNRLQEPVWQRVRTLQELDQKQQEDLHRLIKLHYVVELVVGHRDHYKSLQQFREAWTTTNDTERIRKYNQTDFRGILKALPVWLVNMPEVKDALPLKRELFDVLIIDEATQCDMASCLPLIQRAKRVVIAGDPAQLRHVSFLSRSMQSMLRDRHTLSALPDFCTNYRENSILHLAINRVNSGDQLDTLDEHYRSLPPIIQFSNQYFYESGLRIMTQRPEQEEEALQVIFVSGKRNRKGENTEEAERIIDDVRKVVEAEASLYAGYRTSIGILSPLRAQADLLGKMIMEAFSISEIEKHNLRVGTPYSFQGEERDHMYLSMAVDPDSHHSAFIHIDKEDVFNVAITRARRQQIVYTSVEAIDVRPQSLLHKFLEGTSLPDTQPVAAGRPHDVFLKEVLSEVKKWGLDMVWPDYAVAGLSIDMLIKRDEKYMGIDLVGYPGDFETMHDVERYRILGRAGIVMFPLPYSDWHFNHKKTKEALHSFLFDTE